MPHRRSNSIYCTFTVHVAYFIARATSRIIPNIKECAFAKKNAAHKNRASIKRKKYLVNYKANTHTFFINSNKNSMGKSLRVGLSALALCPKKKDKGAQTNAPIPFVKKTKITDKIYKMLVV